MNASCLKYVAIMLCSNNKVCSNNKAIVVFIRFQKSEDKTWHKALQNTKQLPDSLKT